MATWKSFHKSPKQTPSWEALRESPQESKQESEREPVQEPSSEPAQETLPKVSFEPRKPDYSLEDVIMNPVVAEQIRVLKSRIKNHELLYDTWGLRKIDKQGAHIAVCFYGPPGTGKTMCAEGLAQMLGKDLIEVNYAEIESKYVGETGKNICEAFRCAKETGAVLFFDEGDAILGKRMTDIRASGDQAVNNARAVMLKELDHFDGVVVFATNLIRNFDSAFDRRIPHKIEVPLPDAETRLRLWKHIVLETIPGRDALDWDVLVKESNEFSGADIKNAVVSGCSEAVMPPEGCEENPNPCLTTEMLKKAITQIFDGKKAQGISRVTVTDATPEEVAEIQGKGKEAAKEDGLEDS